MKKKILFIILLVVLLLAAGSAWFCMSHYVIDSRIYAKNAQVLDLRGEEVSISHFEKVSEKLPECEILWNVPFQGEYCPSNSTELTAKNLTEDMEMLAYFPDLETLDARNCNEFSQLSALQAQYPELKILAAITVDGTDYAQDTEEITLASITETELSLLPYLPALNQVTVTEGGDGSHFQELKAYCQEKGITFQILLNGELVTEQVKDITLANVTEDQAALLALMPWLEAIHLPEPEAKAETLLELVEKLPDTRVTWEKTVLGMTFAQDAVEIDLTDVIARAEGEGPDVKTAYEYGLEYPVMGTREEVPTTAKVLRDHPFPDKTELTEQFIAEAEAAMEYFPEAEKLVMCGAWLDNEAMAQFRERNREAYKVVWTVQCGDVAPNTDTTFFMPTKYGVPQSGFNDFYSYNLRYCEDIVAMDIGHMRVGDIEFVEYMPELKYLVLFNQPVTDISPLASCKKLVYLEMYACVFLEDYSPLLECTALEDLNISRNSCDIAPVLQMTWLKNLWLVGYEETTYHRVKAALPDVNLGYYYGNADDGWRNLPNYYKMRDALLMFYME